MSTQWYETFFQGIALEMWDRCTPPEMTRAEVDFILEALECRPQAHLLDIPCGNGRHCREIAARGYRMTGIDLSREYIDAARAVKDLNVEWICDNMCNLREESVFDGAFCFGNAFGYMEHNDTRKFLAGVSRALKPGARFLMNACCAESLLPRFKEHEWCKVGDIYFLEENRYAVERSCVETEFTFIREGKTETRSGRQYIYTLAEIQRMLAEVGLKTLSLMGGLDKKPFAMGNEVYLLAQKSP